MYSYISGTVVEKNPAFVVIDNQGIGYLINITLNTFTAIGEKEKVKLFVHLAIREDAHVMYGFYTEQERSLFLQLITVSGVGCNTARLILSSMTVKEAVDAIATNNIKMIQSVKGIGAKTAQRIVVDLHDKVGKMDVAAAENSSAGYNTLKEEALSALMVLGFSKLNIEKTLDKLLKQMASPSVEDLIKEALRLL
ncbi:MAG: Holliday junction branch migration protein RuvA [Bacteroidia bacterium]|nr:Holliday junction branch migration protein RuvA [Bacteroidales bacterium]MDO5341603.1 Holliday junction branch migration protein RuvA [Bacteroidia bacterium]